MSPDALRTTALGSLLAAAVLLVYAQSLRFDFVGLDDAAHVTANGVVKQGLTQEGVAAAFSGDLEGNWIPLTWLSHMADVELFGLDAGWHHATNVFLHLANTLLLFGVLLRATGNPVPSALAAGLWALHPLRVESVAWVAERKDVLSGFFGLLAMAAYVGWARRGGALRYAAVFACMALSLLSKAMLVTLPFLLLLLDYWPLGRMEKGRIGRLVAEKLPLFALSAGFSAAALAVSSRIGDAAAIWETVPLPMRVANAIVVPVVQLSRTLVPADLSVLYPHPYLSGGTPWEHWQIAGSVLLLAGLTSWFVRARGRPYLAAGWLWYLGALVPVLGLVQVGVQGMADRHTYFPHIGIAFGAAFFAAELARGERNETFRRAATLGLAAVLLALLALSVASWGQARHWRDGEALYLQALRATPVNPLVRSYYALHLRGEGRLDEAAEQLREAARFEGYAAAAEANLGEIDAAQGRPREAIRHYRRALEIDPELTWLEAEIRRLQGARRR